MQKLNYDKQTLFEHLTGAGMEDGECGAFLVWGGDSTIRIIEATARSGMHAIDYEVIPGISAAQTAKHKTTFNRIGKVIEITTGKRIAEGFPNNADSVFVMLDAENGFKRYADRYILGCLYRHTR